MAKPDKVVPLFVPQPSDIPEVDLDVSHLIRKMAEPAATPAKSAIDLTGKPKVVMAIGAGSTGKTTMLRWLCERALERDDGTDLALATADPVNRELAAYFPATMSPNGHDTAAWLEGLLSWVMTEGRSAAIDFGGGDTSLAKVVQQANDLVGLLQSAGVEPVALYLLSPRVSDLTPLAVMERAGFKPPATVLILNKGRADAYGEPAEEFRQIRKHSVYQAALARGAVEIWMPRLFAAKVIEDRRLGFVQAKDGVAPEGKPEMLLGVFDRSRVRAWLVAMEEAFKPVESWLP